MTYLGICSIKFVQQEQMKYQVKPQTMFAVLENLAANENINMGW
jgi:hypothetical protein